MKIVDEIIKTEKYYEKLRIIKNFSDISFNCPKYDRILKNCVSNYLKSQSKEVYNLILKICRSKVNSFKKLLTEYKNGNIKIDLDEQNRMFDSAVKSAWSVLDSVSLFINDSIKKSEDELFLLKKYPYYLSSKKVGFICGNECLKNKNALYIYDDKKSIIEYSDGGPCLKSSSGLKDITIVNILAFLDARPFFIATENRYFNNKMDELYKYFDICDCISLRKKGFFEKDNFTDCYQILPLIKQKRNFVEFKKLDNEECLELYHASLKQFEPLPRCILLYRVVESSFDYYKKLFKPSNFEPADAINYYWNQIYKCKMNPIICKKYINDKQISKNLINELRNESKKIIKNWSKLSYLSNKTIGVIIYETGRNFSAHGGNGERNARYDYGKNYCHINDVNILLELLARYVVELLNPSLKNLIRLDRNY